jgi:hypothetical protein
MPPKRNKAQPTADEKKFVTEWVEGRLLKLDCTAPKDPGRVTLRRLNRSEYNNTIRDLCGVDIKPADDFPADDVGYGFDNIGDVLSLPPILLEKYLTAADRVLEAALPASLTPVPSSEQTFGQQNLVITPRSAIDRRSARQRVVFVSEGSAALQKQNFPATGEYKVRVKAWGQEADGVPPTLVIRVDGKDVKSFPVTAPADKPAFYEATVRVEAGERRVAAVFINPSPDPKAEKPRSLGIVQLQLIGPIGGAPRPLSPAAKLILTAIPRTPAENADAARKIVAEFARRAFRRPVRPGEVDRLMTLYNLAAQRGEPFEQAIRLPLKAALVSPHFLFRVEDDHAAPGVVSTVSSQSQQQAVPAKALTDFELASRLSYFLWSSMPDEELFTAASNGELSKPEGMTAQVQRMLRNPKSTALVENFAGQWLQLRNLKTFSPDTARFKTFDEPLREAMVRETELFFDHIVKTDRSVLEFLDADYTFLNNRLAKHYGITGVYGPEFRKVALTDNRRGGVLTHASVLTVTSNPTRTSPVKRGKWVSENLLGLSPPPPAPDVPELPPVGEIKGTLRQQMEQHRANPSCASCHSKLDPLGFGLENFDAIGAWRDRDNGQPVDASGELPDGAAFDGPAGLRKVLVGKADQFRRCLAEKLLTYALGRGTEYYDKCVIDELVTQLKAGNDRFSALAAGIANSDPFRRRAAKRSE